MKQNEFILKDLNATALSNEDMLLINGGDNIFHDLEVEVGRSIVKFFRALADYEPGELSYTNAKVGTPW